MISAETACSENMKVLGFVIRTIVSVCAAACLVWACFLSPYSAGSALGFVLFGLVIAVCILWEPICRLIKRTWKKPAGMVAVIFVITPFALGIGLGVFFSVNMTAHFSEPVENVRAVMVLGCRVKGEEPSNMLKSRLNAALEVLGDNPEAVCVVSGGQGKGEEISEAEAMRRYLEENGIAPERIYAESGSTNTRENFRFSKSIFEELGISDGIVVVTNEFHQYRAELYARKSGLDVGHCSSKTHAASLLNYWLREWLALPRALLG